ncbi:homoserine lactone transporter [Ruegeria sp. ANG-S4]|uniref:LysE family translocator n=1 Tax=Ruegeria sp. ANG-S4 TaxID=1577904 RepID=UPI00057CE351|nr:LysE family translocator [Ruegeria sp. ANG-S4]KIC43595.1 homoserine lactone transporter [Ruegeria sp. ANG-S4]
MEPNLILALIGATALLVAIPGPNVALIVANTLAYGFRFGVMTVLGTTIGVALQLVVIVLGLAALLQFAAAAFLWLKWIGVAYLVYLGVNAWRRGIVEFENRDAKLEPLKTLFWQGLLIATINPKTLIFNAAFLPQFVAAGSGLSALLITAVIYLAVVMLGDLVWAVFAQTARPLLTTLGRLRHRLTGLLFLASGIGLALARVDR